MRNKYVFIGVGALIVLIGVGFYLNRSKQAARDNRANLSGTVTTSSTPSVQTPTSTSKTAVKPATKTTTPKPPTKPSGTISASASETYLKALDTYKKSGFYIQFYPCQATPGMLTVKKGTKVMLDNRDEKSHVIAIKTQKYNLSSYSFAIATLGTVGVNYVTCDGGGSAVISVQP